MRGWVVALVCASSAIAVAEPLPVKHMESVRVSVANKAQKALALHPRAVGGWRLDLEGDGSSADVIDLTPGTPARTLSVAVVTNTLIFDAARFAGGHVYRVQLRGGKRPQASLVYLFPDASAAKLPKPRTGTQRVRFDENDAPAADDGIARVEKGSL